MEVTIDNTIYTQVSRQTVAEVEAEGMVNFAGLLREKNVTAVLHVKRPRGHKHFMAYEVQRTRKDGSVKTFYTLVSRV